LTSAKANRIKSELKKRRVEFHTPLFLLNSILFIASQAPVDGGRSAKKRSSKAQLKSQSQIHRRHEGQVEEQTMITLNARSPKALALLTGGVLAASALYAPAPAQAKDNSDAYKAGAAILGAASAYMILKGKTVPGIAAAAGAYYAYKTGRKDEREDGNRYPTYPGGYSQYPQYPGNNSYPGSYPSNYPSNSYPNNYPSNYPMYNAPTNYPDYGNYNGGYNTSGRGECRDNRNAGYGGYNGGYGGYSGGYHSSDRYPSSLRATAPQAAAPAPRANGHAGNYSGGPIVLR
jgi:hypothetical protein